MRLKGFAFDLLDKDELAFTLFKEHSPCKRDGAGYQAPILNFQSGFSPCAHSHHFIRLLLAGLCAISLLPLHSHMLNLKPMFHLMRNLVQYVVVQFAIWFQ